VNTTNTIIYESEKGNKIIVYISLCLFNFYLKPKLLNVAGLNKYNYDYLLYMIYFNNYITNNANIFQQIFILYYWYKNLYQIVILSTATLA